MTKTYSSYYEANAARGKENRANGIAFEFRVLREQKRKKGVVASVRSEGSHSPADIITFYKDKIVCISCKNNGYLSPEDSDELAHFIVNTAKNVQVELHYQQSKKKRGTVVLKKAVKV